jgi:hypothetical protein
MTVTFVANILGRWYQRDPGELSAAVVSEPLEMIFSGSR